MLFKSLISSQEFNASTNLPLSRSTKNNENTTFSHALLNERREICGIDPLPTAAVEDAKRKM